MNLHFIRIILSALICAMSMEAKAANKEQHSEPLDIYNLSLAELGQVQISIAAGNSTSLDKAPATASVIYAAEIEAMGARTLDDVLDTVPGVHISLSSLSRLDSVVSIRGIHTGFNPQVLMMLNGVPIQSSLQGGRPSLFRLPVASIERVEVIRGPGSAIYGADAYAGVINVITKDSVSINKTKIGARTGSFDSRDLWLQTSTEWNDIGISFDVAYQSTSGDSRRRVLADLQSVLDGALGTSASLTPAALSTRYQIVDTHLALSTEKLQVNLWSWLSSDAGVGAGGAQALDPTGKDDSEILMGDVTYFLGKNPEAWDTSVRLSYLYYDLQSQFTLLPSGTVIPIGKDGNVNFADAAGVVAFPDGLIGQPGQTSKDTQFDYIAIYKGFDTHQLRINLGAKHQSLVARESKNFGPGVLDSLPLPSIVDGTLTTVTNTPYIFLPDSSRTVRYISLQDEWQMTTAINLTAGLRYDDYSDFGSTTNPRIALVWAANEKLTTKLLLGSAFRAPSFSELYQKNNPVVLGREDLKPEQINSEELSFNYRATQNVQTTLTLFKYQAKKMIDFVDDLSTVEDASKYAANVRDQDGKGFEFEVNWKPSSTLNLGASYSKQSAIEANTNSTVPDAPGEQIKANLNWMFASQWSLNSQLNWVGNRERVIGDLRPEIANYTRLNVTLNRKNILPDVDMSLAVRNLNNSDSREPSSGTIPDDYPLESRSFWLGLAYAFK